MTESSHAGAARAGTAVDAARLPRLCYAALHVVVRDDYVKAGHSVDRPGRPEEFERWIDWEQTAGLRRWVDGLGFGVAEAMDTAQRFEIGWPAARRLIEQTAALELRSGCVAGVGSDQRTSVSSDVELIDVVVEQAAFIRGLGGIPVLLPMLRLPERGAGEREYVDVYAAIVDQLDGPLFLHWLGEMFHPGMRGYFPGDSLERVLAHDPAKVRGVKLSLLDAELEVRVRRRIAPRGQIVLTGDDFHFADLLEGSSADAVGPGVLELDGRKVPAGDFSHALLGALDAVAEPASRALRRLARGDVDGYRRLMAPAEELARHVFEPPTSHYKAGLAYHAWLRGLQSNAMLPNRVDLARDSAHYRKLRELARRAGSISGSSATARS